jgi:hypothetical protein
MYSSNEIEANKYKLREALLNARTSKPLYVKVKRKSFMGATQMPDVQPLV